jgi:hypothetical protein
MSNIVDNCEIVIYKDGDFGISDNNYEVVITPHVSDYIALQSQIGKKMLALIEQTEWVSGEGCEPFCAFCNNYKRYGHDKTCQRNQLLSEISEIESAVKDDPTK